AIDRDVVWAVESLAIIFGCERADGAVAFGDRHAAATPDVSPLGNDEPSPAIEHHAVGSPAWLPKDCRPLGFGIKPQNAIADVREEDRTILSQRAPLGELRIAEDLLQLCSRHDDAACA